MSNVSRLQGTGAVGRWYLALREGRDWPQRVRDPESPHRTVGLQAVPRFLCI